MHKLDIGQFKDSLRRYFKGSESLGGQPLPEVNKALIEDAPRVVRLTIWGVILFFVFLIVWASVAPIDEVTRGEGKAIPSSKVQKIQNLEGGIVAEIFAKEDVDGGLIGGAALKAEDFLAIGKGFAK